MSTAPGLATTVASGLENVVVAATRLSHVDGEAGRLVIGGFPLEELAPHASFEEALFLLWRDRLPEAAELGALQRVLSEGRRLAPATRSVLEAAAAGGLDPMDALRTGAATLAISDPALCQGDLRDAPAGERTARAARLVAALPVLVATYHRLRCGAPPVAPDPRLGHAANILWMLSGCVPEPGAVRALDTYLVTAIDHGMNASTFAARVIVSTRSDLLSALLGALGALKGPLHGGAPGPALDMVLALRAEAARSGRPLEALARAHVREAIAARRRIMGFGHRVYRVRDPRADVLGTAVSRWAGNGEAGALLRDAAAVERVVLEELSIAKPERRLQTNVEFYTALLLHALGLPADLFTPTFAIARSGGWTAHVLEQVEEDRLIRPASGFRGETARRWVPLDARGGGAVRRDQPFAWH
jgi:citrate synthase